MSYNTIEKTNPASLTQDRWSEGVPHHPMSVALMSFIENHDFKNYNDYFCWRSGGDGDNGEQLMFEMDPFFEWLDTQKPEESYNVNGLVAVVYRPEYGIGWSSHDKDNKKTKFLSLNGQLARMVESKDWKGVEELVHSRYPDMYLGSLENLRIEWLDQGTIFEITEHDGYESIHINSREYMQAV